MRTGRWVRTCVLVALLAGSCDQPPSTPAPVATTLEILVTDADTGVPLPSRAYLYGADAKPVRMGTLDMYNGLSQDKGFCELAPGVIGSYEGILLIDGSGEMPVGGDDCGGPPQIPFGTYHVKVMHGIEYEMFDAEVTLDPGMGKVVLPAPLERAWSAPGTLAADLHVHTARSNDSGTPVFARLVSEITAGVQVVGASDHNYNGSFENVIANMHLRGQIASIPGNEVTVDVMHANVFPATIVEGMPQNGAPTYDDYNKLSAANLFTTLHALPGSPLIQLNHPRLRFAAYFDYAGWDGKAWPPPMPVDFDVLEVMNGMTAFTVPGDDRNETALQDLYTFVRNGHLVAATGNSDTHHMSSVLAGLPRNYVYAPNLSLDPFDMDGFLDALRARRVVVTSGPWLDVTTGDGARTGQLAVAQGGTVHLTVGVRQASFVHAKEVRVWVGGELVQTLRIPDGARSFDWQGDLAVGTSDTWIGVDAKGDEQLPQELSGDFLYWAVNGGVTPMAFINPILVDADGDGAYSAASVGRPVITRDLAPPAIPLGPRECAP